MKKLVSILGDVRYHCTGGFNYGESGDIWNLVNLLDYKKGSGRTNYKLHKRMYVYDEGGSVVGFKYIIDNDCIRHIIFEKEMQVIRPEMAMQPNMLYNAISSPSYLMRGYLFTNDKTSASFFGNSSLKWTSPFTVTRLVADMFPMRVPNIVINTRSGYKKEGMSDAEDSVEMKKDTSLHNTEKVPELDYCGKFSISMERMEFIPCDDMNGNQAVGFSNEKYRDMYFNALKRNFGIEEVPRIGVYVLESDPVGDAGCVEGFVLSEEMRIKMVRYMLGAILRNSRKERPSSGSILTLEDISLRLCYSDGSEEVVEGITEEWVKGFEFTPQTYYREVDKDNLIKRQAALVEYNSNGKKTRGNIKKKECDE